MGAMYGAPAGTTYATPTTMAFTAPSYSPATMMMPGTVGLPTAQSMAAYPSYPGMIPQAYMPSISAGMVTPTITGTGTGAAPAVAGETSAVPNVDQTAVKAATKLAAKKKKIS